jgi:hypothetical protein
MGEKWSGGCNFQTLAEPNSEIFSRVEKGWNQNEMINLLLHFSPIHGINGSGIQPPIATKDILVVDLDSFPPRASKKKKPKSSGPTENINCFGELHKNI